MALAEEDILQINQLIVSAFEKRPEEQLINLRYELEIRERFLRVKEELKHQRELMLQGFAQMEKRFEQEEKRFETMQMQMDKRFEQVDKRFEQVDKRFEQVDKRLESQYGEIMAIHQEIKLQMRWFFATTVGVGGLVVAILKLWPI